MLWGRGRGNRTPNLRFWRPMLCQLSYTPFSFAPPASISTRLHIDQIVKPKLRSGWGSLRGRIHRASRDGCDPVASPSPTSVSVSQSDQYEVGLRSMRAEQKRKGYSSTGRASVSKTEGWGFDSLCPCPRAFFSGLLGVASRSLFWRSH